MKQIGRMITAMVTPFDEQGKVDFEQAKRLAVALLASGNDGLVIAGTTGESPTLLRSEEYELFRKLKPVMDGKGQLIAGTGSNSTAEALEATLEAEKIGVDACLLVVPYYNRPSQEGLYQHFKKIAEATKLSCILYNVPTRTGINLAAETTIRLSQIENIVGVKEASANLEQIAKIIGESRKGFLVWSGNDADTLPIMAAGGYGVISVAGHFVAGQIKQMMEHHLKGQNEKAAEIHRHILPLVNALFIYSSPSPTKFGLNEIGFKVGKTRLPLVEPDEKSATIIRETLKKYHIDLPLE